MALMQITVIPLGTADPSVGKFIADIELFLRERGVDHSLGDMGTVISGDPKTLFSLAHEMHSLSFSRGAKRIVTHITIDDRRDVERGLGEKTDAVLQRLKEGK